MTRKESLRLCATKWWEEATPEQIAWFQLNERRLCCPFEVFHKAVEQALDRSVWTHECAEPQRLLEEWQGERPKATFADIMALLPPEKVILLEAAP